MYLLLVPTFFVFLFCLYVLSHDDFVFLRKNISLEQIFNIALLSIAAGFFGARFVYVTSHFNPQFLNPLVFLLFPYFPGLSLTGGVLSSILFIVFYSIRHKISTARLLDFVSSSMLVSLAFGFFSFALFEFIVKKNVNLINILLPVCYIALSFIFFLYFLPRLRSGELQEGSIGLLFLISFSLISFIEELLSKTNKVLFFLSIEGVISIIVFLISLILLIKQEKVISKLLKLRR